MSAAHTGSLEDMIKQRIREERFDSVIPKRKEGSMKKNDKDDYELSQEKSKEGLGDIYEKVRILLAVEAMIVEPSFFPFLFFSAL